MTTFRRASLLTAFALLALPAAGQASSVHEGSDLTAAPGDQALACPSPAACTFAWDAEGWFDGGLDGGSVVTSWSAQLAPGTKARLRLLRREPGGYAGVAASPTVTATGGVQTFKVHLAVPPGDHTFGIDIEGGSLGAQTDAADDFGTERFAPALGAETRTGGEIPVQPLMSVIAESDHDEDGKGDETEDDCLWTCPSSGGEFVPAPDSSPSPLPSSPPGGGSGSGTGGGTSELDKPAFTIEPRGLVRPGRQADQGWFDLYVANNQSGSLTAKLVVKNGKRVVATKTIEELESGDDESVSLRLNAKDTKALKRAGKLKLSVAAKVQREKGGAMDFKQPLTVVTGGDRRYDGEYRGPGPFVITVDHGAIRSVTASVNAFCPASNRFQMLSILALDGFPVLVGKDGSFNGDGNVISQVVKYQGKLKLKGESKGYASAFKSQMGLSSGNRFFIDACQGATNWTVKKTR